MEIGEKIRKIRELKGYTQEYMANVLKVSQRAYSKIERNEIKIDWDKIIKISSVLEIEPNDLVNFNDSMVFNNCSQSGKSHIFNNYISEKLIESYESRILNLEKEISFLRDIFVDNFKK